MRKGWLIVLLIVVIIVALSVWNALHPEATVAVITPRIETIRAYFEEQAVTELPHDVLVSMPIGGWLEPIGLREGDTVRKGDVVARLDSADLQDRVHQAEQRIAVLETQIKVTADDRLEENALIQSRASVKAIDATVMASEAKLEATRALLEFTKSEVERLSGLVEASSASARELRQAEMEFRRARADFESDKLNLAALKTIAAVSYIGPKFITDYIDRKSFTLEQHQKEATEGKTQLQIEQRNLQRAEIRSPIDGIVLARHQTRRQYLQAGTALLSLGRLDDMEIVAEVLTERATRIDLGDPVEVYGQAIPDGSLYGSVSRVFPAGFQKISSLGVEQQRVKVAVKLGERPPRLGVGFRVYVRIFYDESADALTVPRTCLFRGERGEWHVMVVEDGRTALRTVQVGLMNDDRTEITDGLSAGDTVVAHPSRDIEPDMRVETR